MKRAVALVVALGVSGGCTKYATYGYQYKLQQQFFGGEDPEPAPVEARQLLANAKTVAFYPPDQCINADPSITGRKLQELKANCGVMMSTLERAAQDAGYEVLSWQNLRGTKRAIDYAREANVDVLFEINDFEHDTLDSSQVQHTFGFFERQGDGSESPLQVATPVAQGCAQYAFAADRPMVAKTGAIDIKTVSVADGRDRWHYRKTEAEAIEMEHPKVLFTAPMKPNTAGMVLTVVGGVAVGIGGGLLLAEQAGTDNPLTRMKEGLDTGGWARNTVILGALAIAGGIALQVAVGGEKPNPATTLCDGKFAVPVVRHAPAVDTSVSSQYTFHTGGPAPADSGKDLSEIQRKMLKQFIDTIREARQGAKTLPAAPAPAPAPAAPPATPAPAAPPAPTP